MKNIYSKKQRWKAVLFITALVIIGLSMAYSNILVDNIADEEERKVRLWANTVQEKAELVKFANDLFAKMKEEESRKSKIWAQGVKQLSNPEIKGDVVTFIFELIRSNETVPVILTDENGKIETFKNLDPSRSKDTVYLISELNAMKKLNPPTKISFNNNKTNYLYYKDSKLFEELKYVIDELVASFLDEVLTNSASSPVIYTDSTQQKVLFYNNLSSSAPLSKNTAKTELTQELLTQELEEMREEHEPIMVELRDGTSNYIFYKSSKLVTQLKYFPFIQFFIIGLFILVAYILFSSARKAEQNQVWVGMSKETAHQLGTPISSLMAWLELLKMKFEDEPVLDEIKRDINRLEVITDRFSKIGSEPELFATDLKQAVEESVGYLKKRISKKVEFSFLNTDSETLVKLNTPLFSWVIENLSKNAVDAMEGIGSLTYTISREENWIYLDIKDTGKGIPKNKQSTIFQPGYTTKKRGWGLGLTLVKRIIETYHNAKIEVKESGVDKGTTFRITFNAIVHE